MILLNRAKSVSHLNRGRDFKYPPDDNNDDIENIQEKSALKFFVNIVFMFLDTTKAI